MRPNLTLILNQSVRATQNELRRGTRMARNEVGRSNRAATPEVRAAWNEVHLTLTLTLTL